MAEVSRASGTGPGVITPDGCSVEFYARMTEVGESAIVHDAADDHAWFRAVPA